MILPIIGVVLNSADIDPWFSIAEAGGIISSILTMPPSMGGGPGGSMQQTGAAASIPYPLYLPEVGSSLIVMVNYFMITLLAAIYAFERREL
jgi:ABC-type transport system involved in multi-copper enzyme maturation permease subunit